MPETVRREVRRQAGVLQHACERAADIVRVARAAGSFRKQPEALVGGRAGAQGCGAPRDDEGVEGIRKLLRHVDDAHLAGLRRIDAPAVIRERPGNRDLAADEVEIPVVVQPNL